MTGQIVLTNATHTPRAGARPFPWRWVRLGGGVLILGVLVLRVGTGPFLDGVRRVDATSVATVLAITAATTVVSAWRWRLIASRMGLPMTMSSAVASYYRSQFLNSALPGGVLGDVHRGVRQGETVHDVARGVRSVAWDRTAGQIVQVGLAAATLLVLASPVRAVSTLFVALSVLVVLAAALAIRLLSAAGESWLARSARTLRGDVRAMGLTTGAGGPIVIASALVVTGHVTVFLVAARAAGVTGASASTLSLLPLAVLVLLSMSVPSSIGGWGPREGAAAWAFAAAGLGAARGVETATVYGVLSFVATLPGALMRSPSGGAGDG